MAAVAPELVARRLRIPSSGGSSVTQRRASCANFNLNLQLEESPGSHERLEEIVADLSLALHFTRYMATYGVT